MADREREIVARVLLGAGVTTLVVSHVAPVLGGVIFPNQVLRGWEMLLFTLAGPLNAFDGGLEAMLAGLFASHLVLVGAGAGVLLKGRPRRWLLAGLAVALAYVVAVSVLTLEPGMLRPGYYAYVASFVLLGASMLLARGPDAGRAGRGPEPGSASPRGWVLYDGACGVCARWVPFWAPTLARLGLDTAPLQAPWVAERVGLPPDALLADIRLLLRDGGQYAGADVYRYVMRRLWWAYPAYLLSVVPGLRQLFDHAYRTFAAHRLGISEACGLRPADRADRSGAIAPSPGRRRPFLTAEWRHLVLLSYEIEPGVLEPLVPVGTTLDLWQGRALVSVVGFRFLDVRLRGVPIPFHRNFDEVNLRFYVRRSQPGGQTRRGVVFVRELVPRRAVALLAWLAYHEPYRAVPMRSTVPDSSSSGRIAYEWRIGGEWQRLAATAVGAPAVPAPGSVAAFVSEHHWGYTRRRDGSTLEYEVLRPAWRVRAAANPVLAADVVALYGHPFARALSGPPASALVAEGSPVAVYPPRRLTRSDRVS
jgi:hypothetical protein